MAKKSEKNGVRSMMVVGTDVTKYGYYDIRALKPFCVDSREHPNPTYQMNVAFQEVDSVKLSKNKSISYFVPNNISLLLSNSKKALQRAEKMHKGTISKSYDDGELRAEKLWENCTVISDYIELVQTAIVFGYTALEAFANISIPSDFVYSKDKSKQGIQESYNKEGIERWLSLTEKFKSLLPDIYGCKQLPQRLLTKFKNLEKLRNSIIHQKSIESTDFMYEYFKANVLECIKVPEEIITYFQSNNTISTTVQYEALLLWPWVEGDAAYPVTKDPTPVLNWIVDMKSSHMRKRLERNSVAAE